MAVGWHGRGGAVTASVLAGAVGMTLLTVTGCAEGGATDHEGKPHGTRPDAASVKRAADTLTRFGTARTRTSMETASGGTRVTIEGRGSFDFVRRKGRLRVELPSGADGARPGEHRPVTELIAPGALYMKNRGAGVPHDKWVRVETATLPDGNLVTGGATDPVSAAELLRGARHIVYEGVTELKGERVWHFSGVVNMEAAAAAAPPHARRQLRAAEKGFSGNEVPFDAYLDGEQRLRKVQHRFTFAGGPTDEGEGIAVISTTRLDGFGTRVRVVMPASRDIYAGRIATP